MQRSPFHLTIALLLGSALFALTACAGGPAAVSRTIHKQTVEGIIIALESVAAPKMNDAQELVVTLTDEQGLPVEGADVYLDLEMPAMPMGTNRPIATPGAGGTYRAQTAFTMTGDWTVRIVVNASGQERRATFTIPVFEQ